MHISLVRSFKRNITVNVFSELTPSSQIYKHFSSVYTLCRIRTWNATGEERRGRKKEKNGVSGRKLSISQPLLPFSCSRCVLARGEKRNERGRAGPKYVPPLCEYKKRPPPPSGHISECQSPPVEGMGGGVVLTPFFPCEDSFFR